MLTLLSVYSESARQDFLLPTAENVTLCARAERFGLGRDIALTLSAAGGWHFTGPCMAAMFWGATYLYSRQISSLSFFSFL